MEKVMTGHCYRGSAIETSTDCGNCDGARCEFCSELWIVEGKAYDNVEDARTAEEASKTEIQDLIPGYQGYEELKDILFFVGDEDDQDVTLKAHVYYTDIQGATKPEDGCYLWVTCNKNASCYERIQLETLEGHLKWIDCSFQYKNEKYFISKCKTCKVCTKECPKQPEETLDFLL